MWRILYDDGVYDPAKGFLSNETLISQWEHEDIKLRAFDPADQNHEPHPGNDLV